VTLVLLVVTAFSGFQLKVFFRALLGHDLQCFAGDRAARPFSFFQVSSGVFSSCGERIGWESKLDWGMADSFLTGTCLTD
jgi:hypothetical protein